MVTKTLRQKGFTLLELLVVIAIIGVLASVILASMNVSRQKAQYVQVAQQLKEIEWAFRLYISNRGTAWPNTYLSHNPALAEISHCYRVTSILGGPFFGSCNPPRPNQVRGATGDFPNFSTYLGGDPQSPLSGGFYNYFNRDIPKTANCMPPIAGGSEPGVSIRVGSNLTGAPLDALFTALDNIIDGGDGEDCGKLLYENTTWNNILYIIANDSSDIAF